MAKEKKKEQINNDPFRSQFYGDDDGDGTENGVEVMYGIHNQKLPISGMSVKDARDKLVNDLGINVDPSAVAIVSSGGSTDEAGEDYTLKEGDKLIFNKPSAEKGSAIGFLFDKSTDPAERAEEFISFLQNNDAKLVLEQLITRLDGTGNAELIEAAHDLMEGLQMAPLRPCTVIHKERSGRYTCVAENGEFIYPHLLPKLSASKDTLEPGDQVLVDRKGVVIVMMCYRPLEHGSLGTFIRKIGNGLVEITDSRGDKSNMYAHQRVLEDESLKAGATVCYHAQKHLVHTVIDEKPKAKHRFVEDFHIPNVTWDDVANVHNGFEWLMRRTRKMVFEPESLEAWPLDPMISMLLVGPPGTGKTFHIKAYLRSFYEMLQQKLGTSCENSRVIRVRPGQLLSMWLGESDKNIDSLFDDMEYLGREEVTDADNKVTRLPVVVILEEADSMSMGRRDDGNDAVYSRIMGSLLQRLDDANSEIKKLPLIIISTTNRPQNIDAAMMRRLAHKTARFGRLSIEGLQDVMKKIVPEGMPISGKKGSKISKNGFISSFVEEAWNDESRGFEANMQSQSKVKYYRKSFLTPALVDSAFRSAVDDAAFGESESKSLTVAHLVDKLNEQVDNLMLSVTPFNLSSYVDVPEGDKVVSLKPLSEVEEELVFEVEDA